VQLVRVAIVSFACSAQWELLQATNLADADLIRLRDDWARLDFVSPMENAFLVERALASDLFEYIRNPTNHSTLHSFSTTTGTPPSGGLLDALKARAEVVKARVGEAYWRHSWSFKDELHYLKGNQILIEGLRHMQTNRAFVAVIADCKSRVDAMVATNGIELWMRSAFEVDDLGSPEALASCLDKVFSTETQVQLVLTAIAIKRFQLRHGSPPESLGALVPVFADRIPEDPSDGMPLRYRRDSDGSFVLYSIGKDGVDNGGNASPIGTSRSFHWNRGQDWVWPQPATDAEVEAYQATQALP
jgi:hypothetical protein